MSSTVSNQEKRQIGLTTLWRNGTSNPDQLQQLTKYSTRSMKRLMPQLEAEGEVTRKKYHRESEISPNKLEVIEIWLEEKPTMSCQAIAIKLGTTYQLEVSAETVRRHLHQHQINYRYRMDMPNLTDHHKLVRKNWCKNHLNFPWDHVIFTDESWFQLERNTVKLWSRHQQKAKKSVKVPAVMVWAAISSCGPLALSVNTGGVTAQRYIGILQESFLPAVNAFGLQEWYLQQDNAPAHRAIVTQNFLAENNVQVLDWPALSPDLNIIERVWAYLKKVVEKRMIDDEAEFGPEVFNIEHLQSLIVDEWHAISDNRPDFINNLYSSIGLKLNQCYHKGSDTVE